MKMYKKKKLQYKNGYIVKDDKIISVDNKIVDLFNELEEGVQLWMHEQKHPVKEVEPAIPFSRVTEHGKVYPHVTANTTELDAVAEKAMKIMDEIDAVNDAEKCNQYFDKIHPLIEFVNNKFVVDCDQEVQHRFDLAYLGNPLEIKTEDLCELVTRMFTEK